MISGVDSCTAWRRGLLLRRTVPTKPAALCLRAAIAIMTVAIAAAPARGQSALVFQSDFGSRDGAVAAMKGIAYSAAPGLAMYDLTHDIPPFDIWEAAYRLAQAAPYWPVGTVFVSVVDPGVGTSRRSVVLKTKSGHYFVSPDNGSLTLVAEALGVAALRAIDETRNRRPGSERSYTFHGRDVYAYTGARLAGGRISFDQVGPVLPGVVVRIPYAKAGIQGQLLTGGIPILDVNYGNVWTNIQRSLFDRLGSALGDSLLVTISRGDRTVFRGRIPFVNTFADVAPGQALVYINSLNRVAVALNQGSFAEVHHVDSGPEWTIEIRKPSQ